MCTGTRSTSASAALGLLLSLLLATSYQQRKAATQPEQRNVEVRFIKSPFGDYLFYLLYRHTGHFPDLERVVPLGDIPTLDELISLPEVAASADVRSYSELHSLALPYRDAKQRVVPIHDGGTVHYRILAYEFWLTVKRCPLTENYAGFLSQAKQCTQSSERSGSKKSLRKKTNKLLLGASN